MNSVELVGSDLSLGGCLWIHPSRRSEVCGKGGFTTPSEQKYPIRNFTPDVKEMNSPTKSIFFLLRRKKSIARGICRTWDCGDRDGVLPI